MRKIILTLALVLTFTVGWAQKPRVALGETAFKAYCDSVTQLGDQEFFKGGDYDKAYDYYLSAYKFGGLDAAFMLGVYNFEGIGRYQNIEKAMDLWVSAANAGNPDSAYKIGECLLTGNGVEQDKVKAIHWIELADTLGSMDATFLLGSLYKSGMVVPKNIDIALVYWKKAADKGDAKSQEALGIEYFEGKNTKRNMLDAVKYLKLAAEQGQAKAAFYAGVCCEKSYGLPSEDLISAAYYYMIAADAEIPEAQYRLALLYTDGKGVDQNLDRATYWLQQAQKNGLKIQ